MKTKGQDVVILKDGKAILVVEVKAGNQPKNKKGA